MCLSVAVSFAPVRDKCKLRALRVCQRTTVKRGIKTQISRFAKVQEIVVKHLSWMSPQESQVVAVWLRVRLDRHKSYSAVVEHVSNHQHYFWRIYFIQFSNRLGIFIEFSNKYLLLVAQFLSYFFFNPRRLFGERKKWHKSNDWVE